MWQDWFAWHPVTIDGIRYWLQWVQRRRVTFSEALAPFAAPTVDSFWQYRAIIK